jgi:5'-methylthioadenosine phosphorylase
MKPLGIISGTVFLQRKGLFADLRQETLETRFGTALVLHSAEVAFIPRHGTDPQRHILPHLINHQANMLALKELGVGEVIGINSTGSLKRRLKPGMLVVPDDYLMPTPGPTVARDKPLHITPMLDPEVRRKLVEASRVCAVEAINGGIYWQTAGPRLETRSEIAMMAQFADLVGMTMASEAIVSQELEMPYASLCSVDNFAHGIGDAALSTEEITLQARRNAETILRILTCYRRRTLVPWFAAN